MRKLKPRFCALAVSSSSLLVFTIMKYHTSTNGLSYHHKSTVLDIIIIIIIIVIICSVDVFQLTFYMKFMLLEDNLINSLFLYVRWGTFSASRSQDYDVNTRCVPVSEPRCKKTSLSKPSSLLWLVLADSSINCALQEVDVIIDKCPRYRVITLGNGQQAWYHDVLCVAYVMGIIKKQAEVGGCNS